MSRKKVSSGALPVLVQFSSTEKMSITISIKRNPITRYSLGQSVIKLKREGNFKLTRILFGVVTVLLELGGRFRIKLRCCHRASLER